MYVSTDLFELVRTASTYESDRVCANTDLDYIIYLHGLLFITLGYIEEEEEEEMLCLYHIENSE